MAVSAREWAASDSIAAEPEMRPATSLAAAMARFAAPATMTVPTLSRETSDTSGLCLKRGKPDARRGLPEAVRACEWG
ncbi:hypothetical protein Prum_082520 [Phytohabitans rumicis]|uniref:Uncharacterized protein n=1 Tax=Phytohabitans rumicis TaxID=1076125 RepID=A0A6V8LG34_9ACTN|nr:hypothetical protein Prum_082520 [Phytohabitans rumicis]